MKEAWPWVVVVLTGAALVALIAFPVWRGPEEGHRTFCMSNVKQLSVGMLIYQTDFDDRLPLANWADAIHDYMKSDEFLRCPQVAKYGYAMNLAVVGAKAPEGDSRNKTTVLLFETDVLARNVVASLAARNVDRHEGGSNVSYLDMHTKKIPIGELP